MRKSCQLATALMGIERLVQDIQERFIHKHQTLSVAESCTGGALAACLTQNPGCSAYFLGGVVAYSNSVKVNLLGVSEQDLKEFGAVSEQVVLKMAKGVMELTGSDYSIAVSGIAGPEGGTLEKPVGTVWAAIGKRGSGGTAWLLRLHGNRQEIIQQALFEILHNFNF